MGQLCFTHPLEASKIKPTCPLASEGRSWVLWPYFFEALSAGPRPKTGVVNTFRVSDPVEYRIPLLGLGLCEVPVATPFPATNNPRGGLPLRRQDPPAS